ncbi:MAG: phage holin family protein [Burkholderiales bacterium]|jgi:uncharacterized membrane protein YqjE|nr:phage holin family protein [Burkholderiales bacterium]
MGIGPETPESSRLLASVKRLARTFLAILQTRIEIVGTELEEERIRFGRLVVLAVTVAFFFNAAVMLGIAWLVVALWDSYRHATMGVLAILLLGAAIGLLLYARHNIKTRPKPFSTTLAELAKDRERLAGGRSGGPAG